MFVIQTIITIALLLVATVGLTLPAAAAGLIDFDSAPSPLVDAAMVTNQYNVAPYWVTFGIDADHDLVADGGAGMKVGPHLEAVGADTYNGFLNDTLHVADTENPSSSTLGDYFLRYTDGPVPQPGINNSGIPYLIIDYTNSVTAASGEIWDIDGYNGNYEQWTVNGYDSSGNVVATDDSGPQYDLTLDGRPWMFQLQAMSVANPIVKISVAFTGDKPTGIGLAFDNFSPAGTVPEPGAMVFLTTGVVGILGWRRQRLA